ncbi:hypothetical protein O9992_27275 [Vibrio lentus]|nr:hypothetical protein [Vibrio lentus]
MMRVRRAGGERLPSCSNQYIKRSEKQVLIEFEGDTRQHKHCSKDGEGHKSSRHSTGDVRTQMARASYSP